MAEVGSVRNANVETTLTGDGSSGYAVITAFSGGDISTLEVHCRNRAGNPTFNDARFALYWSATNTRNGATLLLESKYYGSGTSVGGNVFDWYGIQNGSSGPMAVSSVASGYIIVAYKGGDGLDTGCSAADKGDWNTTTTQASIGTASASWPATYPGDGTGGIEAIKAIITYSASGGSASRVPMFYPRKIFLIN